VIDLSIISPTYNEIETVSKFLENVQAVCSKLDVEYEIIVVDDNSPDGTLKELQKYELKIESLKVISRVTQRSLAGSINDGLSCASGVVVLVMDFDLTHNPSYIPELYAEAISDTFVIGSRFIGSTYTMVNKYHFWSSLVFNKVVSSILGLPTSDNLSGYFAVKRTLIAPMINQSNIFHGYGDYFMGLIYFCKVRGIKLKEIPIVYNIRQMGKSKSRFFKLVFTYSWRLINLRLGSKILK
jgi:dolichol-phosphate mannosyltransferase